MLCLSRKENERLRLVVPASSEPQEIEIVVVATGHAKVRLGIVAEREVEVSRWDSVERRDAA